ncbi:MAG: PKD domain-containing protein, partial [Chitinophagales bacterium]
MKQYFTLNFYLFTSFLLFLSFFSENVLAQQEGDNCNNPLVFNGNSLFYSGTTCGYGNDYSLNQGLFLLGCSPAFIGGDDIVMEFTPSISSCYTFEIEGDNFASFAVYEACPNNINFLNAPNNCVGTSGVVGTLSNIPALADILAFDVANQSLQANTTYYIVVSSVNNNNVTTPCVDFQLNVFIPDGVANDFCNGALPLVGTGSNYEATDCGEPDDWTPAACSAEWSSNENGVWYTFNNPTQQDVTLNVYNIECQGGGQNLQMGVWTNNNTCDLSAEAEIGCLVTIGDATTTLSNLPAGDYYLFVDGNSGADCTWNFGGTLICDANPPIPPDPLVLCTGDDLPATLSVTPDNPANTIEWYASPNVTSATPFATGASIPTPAAIDNSTAATYTLYVTETNVNGTEVCQSGPASVIIQISNTPASPTIIPPAPICIGGDIPTLSASGAGNINWYTTDPTTNSTPPAATGTSVTPSPALVNNNAVGTYPFWATVDVPPNCESEPTQVNIVVQSGLEPNLQDTPLCQNATLDLNTIDDDAFTGVWSGNGVTGTIFDATGLTGNQTLTFTPDGDCEVPSTATISITISQTPNLIPATICEGETINLTTLLDPLYPNGNWVGTGVSGNTFDATNLSGSETISFFSTEICVNQADVTITITPADVPNLTPTNVCETETLDLTTIDDDAFSGTWSGNGVTGTTFDPNGLTGNQTLTFTPDGNCEEAATVVITLDASQMPSLTPTNVCETETLDLTTIDDDAFSGTWSGNGVTGTTFDPDGLSGNQTLTFTPDGNCEAAATVVITLDASQIPNLTPTNVCETETLDLTTIDDDAFSGTWSGNGVSGTTFDPNGLSGNQTLTFTPDGNCEEAATVVITLDASQMPSLTPTNVCETETLDLTTIDDDAFSGTWSGNGVTGTTFDPNGLSGNQTLTFTPDGNCEEAAIVTISLDASQMPSLTPTNVCETETLDLTTIDDDAFSGTWSGNGVSGTTFDPNGLSGNQTLTFTPDGNCEEAATVVITLDASQMPSLTPTNVCETETLDLTTIDDDAFSGTWSGNGVTGTTFDPNGLTGNQTLTFTPDGNCEEAAIVTISLDASQMPSLTPTNVCETETLDLTTIDDDAFSGTWSGNGVTGTTFDPNGLSGNQTLTFTPDGDCEEAATVVITLDASQMPSLTPTNVCETETLDLTTIDDDAFSGTWSGNGVTGTTFDPNGLSGNQTLTFTPDGDCEEFATVVITLDASQMPSLTPTNICETETLDLTTIDDDSFSGTWSGNGVTGTTFDPNGLSGNQTLTFTPDGDCEAAATVVITLDAQPTADFTVPSEICADGTNTVSVEYTGSADVNTATFDWDFGGGTETSTGNETYDISFASAGTGTATISLTVTENGCPSDPFTQNITLAEPLLPPLVNCSATITDVVFDWNDVTNATDYEISVTVNGSTTVSPTLTGGATTHTESGLNQGDEVEITIIAIGGNTCGDSPEATSSCIVQNCPDNPIDIGNVPTDFCDNETTFNFSASPNGVTISGDGVVANTFEPSLANNGVNNINFNYIDADGCEYNTPLQITVNAVPTADFTVSPNEVCNDGSSTITVTYTGTASPAATFNWNFDGGNETLVGTETYEVLWDTEGSHTITLTVTENACASDEMSETITVTPLPDASWQTQSICEADGTVTLLADVATSGIWSGNGISDNGNGTADFDPTGLDGDISITFTTGDAPCEQTLTQDVTVTANPDASWTSTQICEQDGIITLSPDGTNGGTWSGNGISDNGNGTADFDPNGLDGDISITYTVGSASCEQSQTQDMNVTPLADASWQTQSICEADGTVTLSADVATSGTWSGNGISDNGNGTADFNPTGLDGDISITFTTGDAPCEQTLTQDVTVTANPDASWTSTQICEQDGIITFSPDGTNGGTWSGNGISDNGNGTADFDPNGLDGDIAVTYTVGSADCEQSETRNINVVAAVDVSWTASSVCQNEGIVILMPDGTANGIWSGDGITNVGDGTAQFDPSGLSGNVAVTYDPSDPVCPQSLTQNIMVTPTPDASFTADAEVCADGNSTIQVAYSGSNDVNASNFLWDFGGGVATQIGTENYEVSFNNTGNATATISLIVSENGCESILETETISLNNPLNAPQLICGTATTSSVSFDWNAVTGATDYELTVQINGGGATAPFSANNATTYEEANLQEGDEVTLCITNISANTCDNETVCLTCEAQNCPANPIDIGNILDTYCLDTQPIILNESPNGVTFSGDGVLGNTFDPVSSGITQSGTYTINYDYTNADGCAYSLSHDIFLNPIPTADFTATSEICNNATDFASINYTGSATTAAVYNWDFDGGNAVAIGNENYEVTWPNAGNYTIGLTVEENGCISELFTQNVTVIEPLALPVLSCGTTTTSSVEFVWNDINGATEYELTIDDGNGVSTPFSNGLNTTYLAENLTVGQSVTITVVAVGDAPCGNTQSVSISCTASDCPTIELEILDLNEEYCESEGIINITVSPLGGTLSGEGIVGETFNTTGLDGTYTITYDYIDTASNCDYSITQDVTVFPIPTADFTLSDTEVCADGTSEITVTYTGSAAISADFVWDFGDANATAQGNETYTLTYSNGSTNGDISLTVTENGCVSTPFILNVNISEPLETPNVSCIGSTTNSVTFSWVAVANATGYEITYNTPTLTNQTETLDAATTEYTVSGLNVNELADISVIALGDAPCGNSEAGIADCTAQNCPTIELEILDLNEEYCES